MFGLEVHDKARDRYFQSWGLSGVTMYDGAVDAKRIKIEFK